MPRVAPGNVDEAWSNQMNTARTQLEDTSENSPSPRPSSMEAALEDAGYATRSSPLPPLTETPSPDPKKQAELLQTNSRRSYDEDNGARSMGNGSDLSSSFNSRPAPKRREPVKNPSATKMLLGNVGTPLDSSGASTPNAEAMSRYASNLQEPLPTSTQELANERPENTDVREGSLKHFALIQERGEIPAGGSSLTSLRSTAQHSGTASSNTSVENLGLKKMSHEATPTKERRTSKEKRTSKEGTKLVRRISKSETDLATDTKRLAPMMSGKINLEKEVDPDMTGPLDWISEECEWAWARAMYQIDNWAGSSKHQAMAMAMLGIVAILVFGIIYVIVSEHPSMWTDIPTLAEGIWTAWLWVADPGNQSDAGNWYERGVAIGVTAFGILYFSCVVGLVVEAVNQKMEMLKKGKNAVVEMNHTIMLGWTDKSLHFIKEIILANESEGGGVIAVLSDEEKELIESEVMHHFKKKDLMGTRIIVRHGSRLHSPDLLKMSFRTCKSVIVLSNSREDPNKADSEILQVVLNLVNLECSGHIVVEVRDIDNEPLVQLIGQRRVETVVSHDIIGRLMLMAVRQPGLASVYSSVLGFSGSEFYAEHWPEVTGLPYDSLQNRFPDAVPIGVRNVNNVAKLNPPPGYLMRDGDELIVLADDNDSYSPCPPLEVDAGSALFLPERKPHRELILFCGWRRDIRDVILHLERQVSRGTGLHIMCSLPVETREASLVACGLDVSQLRNLTIKHFLGNTAMRRDLEKAPIEKYTSVLILSDESEETEIMQSDSHCLATLVLIRAIQAKRLAENEKLRRRSEQTIDEFAEDEPDTPLSKQSDFWGATAKGKKDQTPIVCEVLDPRTQRTITANERFSQVSDFLQSNDMVAKILAMVSEDLRVKGILDELLQPSGSQLEVLSSSLYASTSEALTFYQMAMRVRQRGETLVGYINICDGAPDAYVPQVNPEEKTRIRNWDEMMLVVITEAALPSEPSSDMLPTIAPVPKVESPQAVAPVVASRGPRQQRGGRRTSITKFKAENLARANLAKVEGDNIDQFLKKAGGNSPRQVL